MRLVKQTNKLTIFGSAFRFGQLKDGVQKAPGVMSKAGISGNLINVGNKVRHYGMIYPELRETVDRMLGVYTANLARKVFQERKTGRKIVNLGGDHSVAIGSINGVLEHDPDTIVVWIDAHADINTMSSSPSGNFHGMPLSFLTGLDSPRKLSQSRYLSPKLRFDSLALIGIRDLDQFERNVVVGNRIVNYSSEDVKRDASGVIDNALAKLDPQANRPIYVSFDIDVFDPTVAKGTGTLAKNGIRLVNAYSILDYLRDTGRVIGMDMVEVNPELDSTGITTKIAMSCIERLFDNRV
jgi:arginase